MEQVVKLFEFLKREPIITRLFAILIAVVAGTIIYFRFWNEYLNAKAESYIIAFFVALGSAVLIDRTVSRSTNLRGGPKHKILWMKVILFAGLIVSCLAVFVLDRGAEIFVMNNNRERLLVDEKNKLIEDARKAPSIVKRMERVAWLRAKVASEAKNDSIRSRAAETSFFERRSFIARQQRAARNAISRARSAGDSIGEVEANLTLSRLSREAAEASSILSNPLKVSIVDKYQRELAREDSLYTVELNAEVLRIEADNAKFKAAGFDDNPIGKILQSAPSMILWAIVFGLLVSAHLAQLDENGSAAFVEGGTVLLQHPGAGAFERFNTNDAMREMVNGFANLTAMAPAEPVDPNKPFKRGDFREAARWLWFRVLTGEFKVRYEGARSGDFAAALNHGNARRKKTWLHNQLAEARKFVAENPPEVIAEKLKEYSDFFKTEAKEPA